MYVCMVLFVKLLHPKQKNDAENNDESLHVQVAFCTYVNSCGSRAVCCAGPVLLPGSSPASVVLCTAQIRHPPKKAATAAKGYCSAIPPALAVLGWVGGANKRASKRL